MFSFLKIFSGRHYRKFIESCRPIVARINQIEQSYQSLTDEQLRAKTEEFPGNFKTRHPPMKQIMPLNKCDYVIVDEFMSAEDKRFREAFGDRVSVDTGDRKSLYIVLDVYDPKAK